MVHQLSTIILHWICEENFSEIRKNVFHKTRTLLAMKTARGCTADLATKSGSWWLRFV